MRRYLILLIWLASLSVVTRGQTLQYWFDEDSDARQTVSGTSGTHSLDVASLDDGIHFVHMAVQDADGRFCGVESGAFLKMEEILSEASALTSVGAKGIAYWFDEDSDARQTVSGTSGTYSLDVASLNDGIHQLHYYVIGEDNRPYGLASDTFLKMEEILSDASALTSVGAKGIAYWFDDDVSNKKTSTDLSGTYSLDVSTLNDGIHLLHYYVIGEDNRPYGLTSSIFLKDEAHYAEHAPNKIVKYCYWLNGEESTARTVNLEQAANPYTLLSLLPLQTMPIRSSMFHFQMDEGVPTLYAKNTFNIRFYDAQGRFVDNFMDNERTFIDYKVSQQVTGAELLTSGTPAITGQIADNAIKWYYLEAQPGDSLELKLDRAATVQLFSPSGEEVYKASGMEAVNWGGSHVEERGTYYVAVHDVTATSSNSVTVNYNHIDKYAILSFDVNEVGVAESFVPITIQGNGFDRLKTVALVKDDNTITADYTTVIDKGAMIAYFSLNGNEQLGDYDLNMVFDDEDDGDVSLAASAPVQLVAPEWGELKVEVEPSGTTFSKANVRIRVKNTGNVSQLYTPLTFSFDKIENVSEIAFDNFLVVQDKEQQADTSAPIVLTDNLAGTGKEAESMFMFIPTIKPKQTLSFYLSCNLSDDVSMYATVGVPVNKEIVEAKAVKASGGQGTLSSDKCTVAPSLGAYMREHTDVSGLVDPTDWIIEKLPVSDFKRHLVEVGQQVVQQAKAVADNAIAIGKIIGHINNGISLQHNLRVYELSDFYTEDDVRELMNSVHLEAPSKILNEAGHPILGGASALLEWQQIKSTCDEERLKGSLIELRKSRDPNDILGYTAESGSKAIKAGMRDVFYTIEFENDPELATASAHTIVINDELDATLFDLSTFSATGIKIGDKFMEIGGEANFSKRTMDLRPAVNVIAQVSLSFNEQTGVAQWTIESLDPMTMEPTQDAFQGALPINTDGTGMGEVLFDIRLKDGLAHGTEIPNKATIVFDTNEAIETPVWTNIIDAVAPQSKVVAVEQVGNSAAEVTIECSDELSGPWLYDVYVQYGIGSAWVKAAENISVDSKASVKIYAGINHGFYCIAKDKAGNAEIKEPSREGELYVDVLLGDVNGDGTINITDAVGIVNYILGNPSENFNAAAADVNDDDTINITDAVAIVNMIFVQPTANAPQRVRSEETKEPQ